MVTPDKTPRVVLKDYIEEYYTITGWSPDQKVNNSWYEENRANDYQIYLKAPDDQGRLSKTGHIQRELDITQSPVLHTTTAFVHVAAPSEAKRDDMDAEMRRIFEEESQNTVDYYAGIDVMRIVNSFPIDKDKNNQCLAWEMVYEIEILW